MIQNGIILNGECFELKEAEKDNLLSCSEKCDLFKPLTCWCLDDYPPCISIFNKKSDDVYFKLVKNE